MSLYKRARADDGRIVVILLLACSFVILNLFSTFHPKKNGQRTVTKLSYSKTKWLHSEEIACEIEPYSVDMTLPNNLRPMFFLPISVNSAHRELLLTIKGVGPNMADNIIAFRELNGPFRNAKDLMRLNRVGASRAKYFETILTFDEAPWKTD